MTDIDPARTMMNRDEQPMDYSSPQNVIVEALPKSTMLVAGAFYVVLAALLSWVLLVSVDTASQVKVMATRLEFYARDMGAADARAARTDSRLDAMEKRMYEERTARTR